MIIFLTCSYPTLYFVQAWSSAVSVTSVLHLLLNVKREFYRAFSLIFSYQHITLVKAIGFGITEAKIIVSSVCFLLFLVYIAAL